jgi:hypothetical protein
MADNPANNPIEVSPLATTATDQEISESLILEYVIRAETAAENAEASAKAASDWAKISEDWAKVSESWAKVSYDWAQVAIASANRAESYFKANPVGTSDCKNDVTVPELITPITGDIMELDANLHTSYTIDLEVKRSVDGDFRLNTITMVAQYVDGLWYMGQVSQEILQGQDVETTFQLNNIAGNKCSFSYLTSNMIGLNYSGYIKYKCVVFA